MGKAKKKSLPTEAELFVCLKKDIQQLSKAVQDFVIQVNSNHEDVFDNFSDGQEIFSEQKIDPSHGLFDEDNIKGDECYFVDQIGDPIFDVYGEYNAIYADPIFEDDSKKYFCIGQFGDDVFDAEKNPVFDVVDEDEAEAIPIYDVFDENETKKVTDKEREDDSKNFNDSVYAQETPTFSNTGLVKSNGVTCDFNLKDKSPSFQTMIPKQELVRVCEERAGKTCMDLQKKNMNYCAWRKNFHRHINREPPDRVQHKGLEDEQGHTKFLNAKITKLEEALLLEQEKNQTLERELSKTRRNIWMLNTGSKTLDNILSIGRTEKTTTGLGYQGGPSSSQTVFVRASRPREIVHVKSVCLPFFDKSDNDSYIHMEQHMDCILWKDEIHRQISKEPPDRDHSKVVVIHKENNGELVEWLLFWKKWVSTKRIYLHYREEKTSSCEIFEGLFACPVMQRRCDFVFQQIVVVALHEEHISVRSPIRDCCNQLGEKMLLLKTEDIMIVIASPHVLDDIESNHQVLYFARSALHFDVDEAVVQPLLYMWLHISPWIVTRNAYVSPRQRWITVWFYSQMKPVISVTYFGMQTILGAFTYVVICEDGMDVLPRHHHLFDISKRVNFLVHRGKSKSYIKGDTLLSSLSTSTGISVTCIQENFVENHYAINVVSSPRWLMFPLGSFLVYVFTGGEDSVLVWPLLAHTMMSYDILEFLITAEVSQSLGNMWITRILSFLHIHVWPLQIMLESLETFVYWKVLHCGVSKLRIWDVHHPQMKSNDKSTTATWVSYIACVSSKYLWEAYSCVLCVRGSIFFLSQPSWTGFSILIWVMGKEVFPCQDPWNKVIKLLTSYDLFHVKLRAHFQPTHIVVCSLLRIVMSDRNTSHEFDQVDTCRRGILKHVLNSLRRVVWAMLLQHWAVLSSTSWELESSYDEYIGQHELSFVFRLNDIKGIVLCFIAPPAGIFSSLVIGDRCIVHPHRERGLYAFAVQEKLFHYNRRNEFLNWWSIGTNMTVWSIPNTCPSVPWAYFQVISLQIRCGVFTLGMEAICSLQMGSYCRYTALICWSNVSCASGNLFCFVLVHDLMSFPEYISLRSWRSGMNEFLEHASVGLKRGDQSLRHMSKNILLDVNKINRLEKDDHTMHVILTEKNDIKRNLKRENITKDMLFLEVREQQFSFRFVVESFEPGGT
ncbi:uncharacterized protein LOC117126191 isoform X1 [Brassica rapa]|uniref:uncharacterized protein LOC117126191 isoform X1 n=1 Tax=Brassica campestris TaxID=3711 RepID=UPI00142DB270|nr:uncharacterized protein LOC117126191 isoform X1 [Brassica rapa]XP_033129591.1 uncharacterized protein LOC117126191 isoform X1 [Brassica rapa]